MNNTRIVTKADLLSTMKKHAACGSATQFVETHTSDSFLEIWRTCTNQEWLIWFATRQFPNRTKKLAFKWADRACRVHAPAALRKAGNKTGALELEGLAPIVNVETAKAAERVARKYAAYAYAYAAAYAAYYAANAAYYASAAYASAADAAYASADAAYASAYASAEIRLQLEELQGMFDKKGG